MRHYAPYMTKSMKTVRVSNAVAAGTTNVNCTSVDMAGYDGVRFIAALGTLTATQTTSIKLQHSDDNSSFSDITSGASSNMADADSNKLLVAEVFRPSKRYVRAVIVRGTANAVIDGVVAEQFAARSLPITADTSVSQQVMVGPAA